MQVSTSNYYFTPIRASAVLTTGYVAGTILGGTNQPNNTLESLWKNNQLILYVAFTIGSLTNTTIKVEFSNDGVTWYEETTDYLAATTGVITETVTTRIFTATGNYRIPIKIQDNFIRISALGTGTVTGSTLQIDAVVGNS